MALKWADGSGYTLDQSDQDLVGKRMGRTGTHWLRSSRGWLSTWPHDPRRLSFAALLGIAYFTAAGVALHLLRPGYDHFRHVISHYAVGSLGFLMSIGFGALGLSCLALSQAVAITSQVGRGFRLGSVFLRIAGFAWLLAAAFPLHPKDLDELPTVVPSTFSGIVHAITASIAIFSKAAAALLLSFPIPKGLATPIYRPVRSVLATLMTVALLALIASFVLSPLTSGAFQKVFLSVSVAWIAATASQMRRRPWAPSRPSGSQR